MRERILDFVYDLEEFLREDVAGELYRLAEWIPEEIRGMAEFLPEELARLRDHVKTTRGQDISLALHVFEERVLFRNSDFEVELERIVRGEDYEVWACGEPGTRKMGWETIRVYQHEIERDGKYAVREFHVDKRRVKRYFLRGWLEVGIWDRGEIYPAPQSLGDVGLSSDKKGQFFHEENIRFSLDAMRNYWDKHLRLESRKQSERPRFVNNKHSISQGNTWHVFVTQELGDHYYDSTERVRNQYSDDFYPFPKNMTTINCLKATETRHAVIANYDSWQVFLHALNMGRRKTMDSEHGVLAEMRNLRKAAAADNMPVPAEIRDILKRVATDTSFSRLSLEDREKILGASRSSPKIRLLFRMAQLRFVRAKTAGHFAETVPVTSPAPPSKGDFMTSPAPPSKGDFMTSPAPPSKGDFRKSPLEGGAGGCLSKWLSPIWQPQWAGVHVGAGDVPEQRHVFRMGDGEIEISCLWRSGYGNTPAYVQVSWAANIIGDGELWLCFVSPESGNLLSEVRLGTHREGGKIVTEKTLGFDPSAEKWAVSLVLREKEK